MYRQAPAFAGGDRSVMDLLAVDHAGRLVVVEVKASEDLHLPLQALDYWIRVRWHAQQQDFRRCGYFPGHCVAELATAPASGRPRAVLPSDDGSSGRASFDLKCQSIQSESRWIGAIGSK